MKKWHMEGIVLAAGRGDDRLELPSKSWKIRWASVSAKPERKESAVRRYARETAGRVRALLN